MDRSKEFRLLDDRSTEFLGSLDGVSIGSLDGSLDGVSLGLLDEVSLGHRQVAG